MTDKGFKNELARALARPDIDQLRASLAAYYDWSVRNLGRQTDDWPDELDFWFDQGRDSDRGLALVMLAAASYDDPDFLALVAAGLLENLLQKPTSELLQRVASEARKTARFRWMLDVPFRHAITPDARSVIDDAVGDMDCDGPLPPRPWA